MAELCTTINSTSHDRGRFKKGVSFELSNNLQEKNSFSQHFKNLGQVMAKLLLLLCLTMALTGVLCSPLPSSESAAAGDDAAVNQRRRRNYTPYHNYPQVVYSHLADDYGEDGEWKKANCTATFNCEEVSLLHCTQPSSRFFCSTNTGE